MHLVLSFWFLEVLLFVVPPSILMGSTRYSTLYTHNCYTIHVCAFSAVKCASILYVKDLSQRWYNPSLFSATSSGRSYIQKQVLWYVHGESSMRGRAYANFLISHVESSIMHQPHKNIKIIRLWHLWDRSLFIFSFYFLSCCLIFW